MKSILLTTTALVAFAGAAAADGHTSISNSASVTLGFNDTDNAANNNIADGDEEIGFYWDFEFQTTATATLDNGLTAGAFFEIEIGDDNDAINDDGGQALSSSDFVLSLEAENGGLFFGDTGRAAEKYWKSAGDMESDGVSTASDSAVIRGDISVGPVDASVSYLVNDEFDSDEAGSPDNSGDTNEALEQLSVGAAAEFGDFFVTLAYQEETELADSAGDFNPDEIFGISAGGTFAGATVTVAYAQNSENANEGTDETTSTGIQVAYPFGPVTATAYFVAEEGTDLPDEDPNFGITVEYADGPISVALDFDNDQDSGGDGAGATKVGIDGSYDVGNGLTMFAGYYTQDNEDGTDYADEFYVAGQFDLGGGASVLVAYAEGEDNADDEIGANDYQEGTTVELSFAF